MQTPNNEKRPSPITKGQSLLPMSKIKKYSLCTFNTDDY